MSNYPDDYRPWLPGGPEYEPWKGRVCAQCAHCLSVCEEGGRELPVMGCVLGGDDILLVAPDKPACESYE